MQRYLNCTQFLKPSRLAFIAALGLALSLTGAALAQSGGGFDLSWSTVDGGGGQSSGGSYTLSGTIGQPEAGGMSGGGYALSGGFWLGDISGSSGGSQNVYLPVILQNQ